MAEYTIELRHVVDRHNIFDFNYPFYDERRRPDFEKNFIRHFYFREIGTDTVDKFKLFLEDKMNTVFPYYNELFKTAQIEYSVLDNYNIKETTTMKRENVGTSSGESYSVGKTIDDQKAETTEDKTAIRTGTGSTDTTSTETAQANGEIDRTNTETFEGTANQTVTENKTKTADESEVIDDESVKKFLDTPQGQVDLSDSKYLTTLNHDTNSRETTKDLTETETGEQSTEKSENTTKTTTGKDTSSNDTTKTGSENTETSTNDNEESNAKTASTFTGEHRTTNDGAVRSRSEGATSETVEMTRRGNIGVDTDADMIQKHIKLQKILTQIEKMFFDECDDLFMLVW